MKILTQWKHRDDRTDSETVSVEPRAGTDWWFVAGVASIRC
jgi:hypothetical protein